MTIIFLACTAIVAIAVLRHRLAEPRVNGVPIRIGGFKPRTWTVAELKAVLDKREPRLFAPDIVMPPDPCYGIPDRVLADRSNNWSAARMFGTDLKEK